MRKIDRPFADSRRDDRRRSSWPRSSRIVTPSIVKSRGLSPNGGTETTRSNSPRSASPSPSRSQTRYSPPASVGCTYSATSRAASCGEVPTKSLAPVAAITGCKRVPIPTQGSRTRCTSTPSRRRPMNLAMDGGQVHSPSRAISDHISDGVNRMSCSVANWTIPTLLRKSGRVSRVLSASAQNRSSSLVGITRTSLQFSIQVCHLSSSGRMISSWRGRADPAGRTKMAPEASRFSNPASGSPAT